MHDQGKKLTDFGIVGRFAVMPVEINGKTCAKYGRFYKQGTAVDESHAGKKVNNLNNEIDQKEIA